MIGPRYLISWLLVGVLAAVGAGAAVLGVAQAPTNAPLLTAASNTLAASGYSQVLEQNIPQGRQTAYLTYQAPDRLGGYIQSGNRISYVFAIGTSYYQSLTVLAGTPSDHLTFYRQDNPGGVNGPNGVNRAWLYLRYASLVKHPTQSGNTYSFSVTRQGQTGKFTYTVNGQYISGFTLTAPGGSVRLDISDVGTSSPVKLPTGAKVVSAPGASTGSSTG